MRKLLVIAPRKVQNRNVYSRTINMILHEKNLTQTDSQIYKKYVQNSKGGATTRTCGALFKTILFK